MKNKKRIFHYVIFGLTFFCCIFLIFTTLFFGFEGHKLPYGTFLFTASFFGVVTLPIIVVIFLSGDD